jgi:hypothetical protein
MPLKEMHFSPTSRINSADATGDEERVEEEEEATSWRTERDSGELSVKVAAVYIEKKLKKKLKISKSESDCANNISGRTDIASHGFNPILCFAASSAMDWYTSRILAGAAVGLGFAKGALRSDLRAGDNFDIVTVVYCRM